MGYLQSKLMMLNKKNNARINEALFVEKRVRFLWIIDRKIVKYAISVFFNIA